MLKTPLIFALRSLRKQKLFAGLNVAGLAVGLACVMLIGLYVRGETSYDAFHPSADRIVRVVGDQVSESGTQRFATTPGALAPALATDLPEVEQTVRLLFGEASFRKPVLAVDEVRAKETTLLADTAFFELFDGFRLLRGDAAAVLDAPGQVVLTASAAQRYFGEADPVGETIQYQGATPLTVTGVMADVPERSHLQFDAVLSLSTAEDPGWWYGSWSSFALFTYARLHQPDALGAFRAKLPALVERRAGAELAAGEQLVLHAEPLREVYLRSDRLGGGGGRGNPANLYIFSAVALFVLLIACVNFTNLATARSVERAREVGVRKMLGATRGRLTVQFLAEAVLLSAAALVVALGLVQLTRPLFTALAGTDLVAGLAPADLRLGALALGGVGLAVGLLAGAYPALVLTRFRPAVVLKGRYAGRRHGLRLRQGLVVLQFSISAVLIAATGVVAGQLRYMQARDLGFDPGSAETGHLVTVAMGEGDAARIDALKERLRAHPGVLGVTSSLTVPAGDHPRAGGELARPDGQMRDFSVEAYLVDTAFVDVYGMDIVAGQAPGSATTADSLGAYVLNETAVREAGYASPEAILGARARFWGYPGEVVGVVRDFHTSGLQQPVPPLGLIALDQYHSVLTLRIRPDGLARTLDELEAVWATAVPTRPFDYAFLDAAFGAQYEAERRFGRLFGVFAGLAILVACLGLFGLATYATLQRTKEIGIRKALGATVLGLIGLLTWEAVKLVAVAFVVATPVAYLAMERWLDGFAYRTDLGVAVFALAGGAVLVIALLTVSAQSIRAATANPVEALRYE